MKNESAYLFLTHSFVRAMLNYQPLDDAYLNIIKSIYPGAVRGQFSNPSGNVDASDLQRVCDLIYQTDLHEIGSASCYSASIVVQSLAFVYGVSSDMVIGIRKQDKKIVGHAWVELQCQGSHPAIVNPGRVDLSGYHVLARMNPEAVVAEWAASI